MSLESLVEINFASTLLALRQRLSTHSTLDGLLLPGHILTTDRRVRDINRYFIIQRDLSPVDLPYPRRCDFN